jgi:hypothetical protein
MGRKSNSTVYYGSSLWCSGSLWLQSQLLGCGGVGSAWVGLKYRVRAKWKLPFDSPGKNFLIRLNTTPSTTNRHGKHYNMTES